MGKIITIKNNKGGVGKTFLTTQLASGLAEIGKKVLILTTDPQNNVFNFLFRGNKDFRKGMKAEVLKGDGEYFRMRQELYFLPLEDSKFSNNFIKALPEFLNKCREKYDYIFIDGIPTLKIDEIFLKETDSIVIPCYADEMTIESTVNIVKTVDVEKIKAIVMNRYKPTATQKMNYEALKDALENSNFLITEPIETLSFIESMISSKKTIWEFSNKKAVEVQKIFIEIIKSI